MIIKRELSCPGTKQKCKMILVDKHKQVRSFRQKDKLEQWLMDKADKFEVMRSILNSKIKKRFVSCLMDSVA